MTADQIGAIRQASDFVYRQLPARQSAEMMAAKVKMQDLTSKCDHTYPDGTTAISEGFLLRVCEICSLGDL